MMKKIAVLFLSVLFLLNIYVIPAYGLSKENEKKLLEIWRSGDQEALDQFFDEYFDEDGAIIPGIWSKEEAEVFRNAENKLVVLKFVFDREEMIQSPYGEYFLAHEKSKLYAEVFGKYDITAVMEDGSLHCTTVNVTERSFYTVKELLRGFGIDDPTEIGMIRGAYCDFDYGHVNRSELMDYTSGWNEIDGNRYYIKSDGTVLTSSATIDGIRYKFGKDGVCQGKYTGYTNSSKGRRYWKNGELVKNKWIKVKGERKYYADGNGYFVTGKRKIQGKDYLFDKNGALLGEAPAVIEYNAPDPDRLDEIDCVRVDFREAVSSGCSLALATCIGLTEQTKGRRVYAFLADEVICGGEVPRIFTVTVTEGDYAVEDEPGYTSAQLHFKENVRYLLPLRKADSLLPEDRFFSNGDALIELRDDLSIASASVQGRKITGLTDMNAVREFISSEKISCGQEIDQDFVRSDDLSEIVKGSDFILEVEIEGIVHDRAEDWTMYNCRLTDTVKAVKNDVRTVYAALPKDSVTLNGKYLLLLNRTRDKSFIYTLSSANGSLYPADAPEAAEVRKLIAPARKKEQNN